jgi:hypothetical protein
MFVHTTMKDLDLTRNERETAFVLCTKSVPPLDELEDCRMIITGDSFTMTVTMGLDNT